MANPKDPRKSSNPGPSANEQIEDRIIRHLFHLTGLQTSEADWIKRQLDSGLLPDLEDRIASVVNRMKAMGSGNILTTQQSGYLRSQMSRMSATTRNFLSNIGNTFSSRMFDLGQSEVEFERRLFEKTIPIEFNFSQPSEDQLRSILDSQPIPLRKDGNAYTIREWFDNISDSTISRINGQIRQGMINGESMDAIMRRVRDNGLAKTRQHAQALARTGVIHSSNQATNSMYRENSDIIKAVKVVVTLDNRTCQTCMWYDANNPYDLEDHPNPPFHVQCRCATTPVTKSWRELGIDLDEAPEGTRASMNGQVPESMTYNRWLSNQTISLQKEVLGATKYRLWKEGGLSLTSFVDRQGRILNLEQIRRKERDVFEDLDIEVD